MSILKEEFGITPDDKQVFSYVLSNQAVSVEILTYGGIIRSLCVKDKNGNMTDIVAGRDSVDEYLNNEGYFGALIGRYANRIYRGQFSIDSNTYKIGINDGKNSLHGGITGFDKYVWDVAGINDTEEPSIILEINSPDGDEGYPGNLKVRVTYTLSKENGLIINYKAVSDKDTVVNLTNHSYFNLNGIGNSNIYNLKLQLESDFYTPNTSECMPYGEILSVSDTPFDFTVEKTVGNDINSGYPQIKEFGGYDHNFIIRGKGYRRFATVTSDETGIVMDCYTDKPGVQLYTGNCIEEGRICKDGKTYKKHDFLCLETQYFPNSTSYPHFPSPVLKAGQEYNYTTEYRFSILK